ncbi:MAG: methyltransferase type 11 [Synergistaceae bacterium]|nr:methyltransferase type 11 [Synergistaceae bacterium]
MISYKKLRKQGKILTSRVNEGVIFLRRFVGAPRQVGSVMPSSPYLTRAMMDKIEWNDVRCMAELGAGTGVFTRAIVSKLGRGENLLVFEIDPALKALIEAEHLGVAVYGDAQELPQIMRDRNIRQLDCVVSSLPFAVLPPRVTAAILDVLDKTLKPGGKLIAYQYSTHMKPYFEKRFANVKISFVLRNVPPAFVYECTKARES